MLFMNDYLEIKMLKSPNQLHEMNLNTRNFEIVNESKSMNLGPLCLLAHSILKSFLRDT